MTQSGNMLQLVTRSLFMLLLFLQLSNYVDCLAEDAPETVFCERFVRSKGYLCEEHKMYTEDGFELLLHRVRIVPAESQGRSDDKKGDIQFDLKVALSHRMQKKGKSITRLTSELKRAESDSNIFSEVHTTEDFVSERAQPFQPHDRARTHSDSPSSHREQGRKLHWPRSSDARDLPDNLPLDLPPSSVEFPAVTIDTQLSNAHPMKTLEPTLLPTTVASNPYTTFDSPAPDVPTAAPIWSEPGETQLLSPEASTVALPPLWYIPGVTQPPVQSEPSDLPGPALPTDEPIFSPELPPDVITPEVLPPVIPDLTTISTTPPSIPEFPSDSAFPEPSSPAASRPEMAGQLPGPVLDQPPSDLGPVAPGELPLIDPKSPTPIEWVEPPLGSEGPVSGIAAAPVEGDKRCRAVLLLHHELLNGDVWFTDVNRNGPSHLLPFILADDGFDVWVGHERATFWSHDNTRLSSSELEYWDWTWDEFVDHDLPIMLTHIYTSTQSKIHVVGVSQSAAVAVAASAQQAVASLIKSFVLLGPSIYHGTVGLQQLQTWAQLFPRFIDLTRPDPSFVGQFNISRNFGMHNWSLGGPSSLITGPDCCISKSLTLFDNGWDGTTSYKNFQHFEQGVLTNTFQRFDYGSASRNLEVYGQITPPAYSPANIPVDIPVQVIFAGNDFFSPPQGVQELFQAMQKLPVKVYLPLYAHFDLLYSSRRYQDVYLPILSFIRDSAQAT